MIKGDIIKKEGFPPPYLSLGVGTPSVAEGAVHFSGLFRWYTVLNSTIGYVGQLCSTNIFLTLDLVLDQRKGVHGFSSRMRCVRSRSFSWLLRHDLLESLSIVHSSGMWDMNSTLSSDFSFWERSAPLPPLINHCTSEQVSWDARIKDIMMNAPFRVNLLASPCGDERVDGW